MAIDVDILTLEWTSERASSHRVNDACDQSWSGIQMASCFRERQMCLIVDVLQRAGHDKHRLRSTETILGVTENESLARFTLS